MRLALCPMEVSFALFIPNDEHSKCVESIEKWREASTVELEAQRVSANSIGKDVSCIKIRCYLLTPPQHSCSTSQHTSQSRSMR
jgi:hypothetical protein